MKRLRKACVVVALIVLSSSFAFAGPFDAWNYRMKITFSGYDPPGGAETLTNFPVLVVLSTNIDLFSYTDFESEVGGDLRFTASNETTELNYEVEQWDTNSESFVWVQVPELFGTNDFIYAYWGNSSATNPPAYTTNGATWTNGYAGVWHMTETNAQDSTSNAVHGAAKGGVTQDSAGKVDGADSFSFASSGYIDLGTSLPDLPAFTVELWWNATALGAYAGPIQHRISGTNGFQVVNNINSPTSFQPNFIIWNGSSETNRYATPSIGVPFGKFIHFVWVYDGSTAKVYVDGTEQSVGGGIGGYPVYGSFISIGYGVVGGLIDETRISGVARSSNWVWACWMNQGSNDVFAGSGKVSLMSTNLRTRTLPPSNIGVTNAELNGQIGLNIGGAENPDVYFCWDYTDKGTTSTGDWGNVGYIGTNWSEGETFSTNITGLLSGSNYHYRCYVTNSTGEDWSDDAESFTTVYLPVITNTGATLVKREAATLKGEITDTGEDTPYVWFYYWIDGDPSTSTVSMGLQSGAFSSKEVDGLIMATNYTYQILASNMAGTVWSGEKSFETLPFGTGTNILTGEGVTDDWFEHANWSVGVPLAGEHVIITNIGKEVLLTNDTVALASFTITNETLTFTNWNTTLNASNVMIQDGGTLTIPGSFTESQMSNRVYIVCSDFTLENGGTIDVDTNGYAGEQGPGKGGSGGGGIGGGGGYGGMGGDGWPPATPGTNYGSANAPLDPGSGGAGYGVLGPVGGSGGGAVRIEATGSVTVNGTITANGGNYTANYGGGGSGGGIYITCDTFAGSNGTLYAKGGNGHSNAAGGGGGGRIAVWYRVPESERQRILDGDMRRVSIITNASDYSDFSGTVSVTNGIGPYGPEYNGELGTVVFLTLTPPSGMVFMCR